MKKAALISLLFLQPFMVHAQTKADYEHVMAKFIRCYNAQQYDSVYTLFCEDDKKYITPEHNTATLRHFTDEYGKVVSYKYLGIDTSDPNHVTVFTTKWSKAGDKTTSFTLDKYNKFETWRFITSSDGIDKMLKKAK